MAESDFNSQAKPADITGRNLSGKSIAILLLAHSIFISTGCQFNSQSAPARSPIRKFFADPLGIERAINDYYFPAPQDDPLTDE